MLQDRAFRKVRNARRLRKRLRCIGPRQGGKVIAAKILGTSRSGGVPPKHRRGITRLWVAASIGNRWQGKLLVGTSVIPCSLGPAGISNRKREGDGTTPAGTFRLQTVMFRPDRKARPQSRLETRVLRQKDGWCDDPGSTNYNRRVDLPFAHRHERLWRDDLLYDLMAVIDHNRRPVRKQRGSAIFLHVRGPGGAPTAGCVAIDAAAMRRLLARVGGRANITIG